MFYPSVKVLGVAPPVTSIFQSHADENNTNLMDECGDMKESFNDLDNVESNDESTIVGASSTSEIESDEESGDDKDQKQQ